MLATEAPFPQYFGIDGDPIDAGYIYFGTANQNPETSPITVYWDVAGTQPAAQPVRTLNGYTVRAGTPAIVYAPGDYSISIRDRQGRLVYFLASSAAVSNSQLLLTQLNTFIANLLDPTNLALGTSLVGGSNRVIDSIATLRTLPKTGAKFAFLTGYYAAGDKGGGEFYLDATDTVSADNGGTIIVAADGARWKRVFTGDLYDRWFGAKVDGVTDETAAIVAMLTSITNPLQQTARLSSGSHLFSIGNITMPAGTALLGPGKGRCLVLRTSTVNSLFLLNSYCRLGGFEIRHPNQVTSGVPTVYPPDITHAAAGCSYVDIDPIRFYNSYDAIVIGDATHGCSNITINEPDGFPLHLGIKIDNCVDAVRVNQPTFNRNITGTIYDGDNSITKWVFLNAIAMRFLRCDGPQVDRPLVHGYKRAMTLEGGSPSGAANFTTVVNPIFDICQAPVETINYQDGADFVGGSMTSTTGYFTLTGIAMPLAGGIAQNQRIKFIGTTFRNFYDGVILATTNVEFEGCDIYGWNVHNLAPVGAITIGANGVKVVFIGGHIDGAGFANSRGIDNQGAFTGTTMVVSGVDFTQFTNSTIFQPSKTLVLGPCNGLGQFFYNGLTMTQNNQGQMCVGVIPAAGTWAVGDRFTNSNVAVGQPKGWGCSVAGTPGTHISEGNW